MTTRTEAGIAVLRKTVGEEYYAKRVASTNSYNKPLRDLTDEYCFGVGWTGTALSVKTRSMLVITMLACMGRIPELKLHTLGAVNNGCSVDEIKEIMLQVAIYCGIPAGVEGTRTTEEVLRGLGLITE